ncbi:MAG: hypothetical protein GTO40_05960 [Deltaproteobacteria bacterium]|nr:hypothetical protein [Deltaproteobacteria bacterium]
MKYLIRSASFLFLLVVFGHAWSEEIKPESFEKLMALSGLQKQVAEFPGMVRAGFEQARERGTPMGKGDYEEVITSIDAAFRPSRILKSIGSQARRSLSESEARDLLIWYESDLGKRITRAEEMASTPAAYQEMIRDARSLLADHERVQIAQELDRLLNATNMAMRLQKDAGIAVFIAVSRIVNPGQPVQLDAFRAQMLAQEEELRRNVELLVIVSFVYSYRDIKIENLEKYVAFNKRPNTKRFNESVIRGMQYALSQSIDRMADSLAVTIQHP